MATRNAPPEKLDRRARRSRRLILDAYAALVPEKGNEKITVTDIVKRADIGRATFYAHFEDKVDLERFIFQRFMRSIEMEIQDHLAQQGGEENIHQVLVPSLALFRIAEAKFEIFKQSAQNPISGIPSLGDPLIERMEAKMAELEIHFQDEHVTAGQVGIFLFSPLLRMLSDWLLHDLPAPVEEMDRIYQSLAKPHFDRLLGR